MRERQRERRNQHCGGRLVGAGCCQGLVGGGGYAVMV